MFKPGLLVREAVGSCQPSCGACCIAPAISSPIPGMPNGKPAGVKCVQLDANMRCQLFGLPERPDVCEAFMPEPAICGRGRWQALRYLTELEVMSSPD